MAGSRAAQKKPMRAVPFAAQIPPAVGLGTSDELESAGANIEQLREVLRLFTDLGGRLIDTATVEDKSGLACCHPVSIS